MRQYLNRQASGLRPENFEPHYLSPILPPPNRNKNLLPSSSKTPNGRRDSLAVSLTGYILVQRGKPPLVMKLNPNSITCVMRSLSCKTEMMLAYSSLQVFVELGPIALLNLRLLNAGMPSNSSKHSFYAPPFSLQEIRLQKSRQTASDRYRTLSCRIALCMDKRHEFHASYFNCRIIC